MKNADQFMQEEFLPFCKRVCDAFELNFREIYSMSNSFLPGTHRMGMRVTENGDFMGDYTLVMKNAKITSIENGVLTPEMHTPFGVIRPYCILEKSTIEKMIQDEPSFVAQPFATEFKYYPEITIKFLK